jgi:AbiTii/Effector-associated domain 7
MSIPEEIRHQIANELTDDSVLLSAILRKTMAWTNGHVNKDFSEWLKAEMLGYENDNPLPIYRILSAHAYADFYDKNGKPTFADIPIPLEVLPEDYHSFATSCPVRIGIKALEVKLESGSAEYVVRWNAELMKSLDNRFFRNTQCRRANTTIQREQYVSILEKVRHRLLTEVLDSSGRTKRKKSLSKQSATNLVQLTNQPVVQSKHEREALRDFIHQRFDNGDIHSICFSLQIDYEDIPGPSKFERAMQLIEYCMRRGLLDELQKVCAAQRPGINWRGG